LKPDCHIQPTEVDMDATRANTSEDMRRLTL